jgi:glycosyltransferase involved in cell wall biosynthesis
MTWRRHLLSPASGERICLFPGTLRLGGVARMMLNLAEELVHRDVGVDMFVTREGGHYWDAIPAGVNVEVGAGGYVSSIPKLARYLRRARPAGLISTHHNGNIASVLARRLAGTSTPLVLRVGMDTSARPGVTLRFRLRRAMIRLTYRHADHIVATSSGVANDVARLTGMPRPMIEVIPNPVLSRHHAELAREPIDHPWLREGQLPVVLTASRLTRQKDLPTMLRAFRLVRDERSVRLLILGDGEERPSVERMIDELGLAADVLAPGSVPNAAPYMARAAVFCLSSRWEGFGNVLVEAMATGTPVVSTDCPSGPAEILDGGRYGALVPVGDARALSAAILRTLDVPPPRQMLIDRARAYSAEVAADRYLAALRAAPRRA